MKPDSFVMNVLNINTFIIINFCFSFFLCYGACPTPELDHTVLDIESL